MRSARALILLGPAALALTGCTTTQRLNERAQLRATRVLASRHAVVVRRADAAVRVQRVTLVRGRAATAVVVDLANAGRSALTDLPISVGAVVHGKRVLLNRRAGLDYFQTHVAVLGAGGRTTWVFTTRRRLRHAARPFATVGAPALLAGGAAAGSVRLAATPLAARSALVRVRVRNPTSVPQTEVPVYVLARRGGRYLAAGRATLTALGSGGAATVSVPLVGSAHGAPLQLQVPPTTFR